MSGEPRERRRQRGQMAKRYDLESLNLVHIKFLYSLRDQRFLIPHHLIDLNLTHISMEKPNVQHSCDIHVHYSSLSFKPTRNRK
jgi:hypothetical protein